MGMKKWQTAEIDRALAKELAEECDIDPIIALIAVERGYTDPAALEEFISDEPCFDDPALLADIEKAADIINNAVNGKIKTAVYGDYDCDGVTATALLYSYLQSRGANCIYYIPDRISEGYGMNTAAVDRLAKEGVKLIVTVDNGIAAADEILYAKTLGIDVVVTDHHLPQGELPPAVAVVDPHRADCPSVFKEVCGAQVAFKLVCVMEGKQQEEMLPYFADLLSVAVTADVMPLVLENRSIVKCGIEKLKASPATGLAAVMNVAAIKPESINSSRIAFGIAPRINAAGRMGDAGRALELLLSTNMLSALKIADEIDALNLKRQELEKCIFAAAVNQIEENGYKYDRVIVADGENWHHGVVGIVASRITERYGKPSVIISRDGENAGGSGRSIEGFSLFKAIEYASGCLTKFGGHELAAGVSLKSDNIEAFRKEINEYAYSLPYTAPVLKLDCKLKPLALTIDLAEALELLEPFGSGNPEPVFGVYGVMLKKITPIGGGKHLRLLFTKGENSFQALLFGISRGDFCFEEGDLLDAAVTAGINEYGGNRNVSVRIKALRISETDDERLFSDIDLTERFIGGRGFSADGLLPTRAETGAIYKFLAAKPSTAERIKYLHINTPGYAKTTVALITLCELGLIKPNANGVYSAVSTAQKTELKNSPIYRKLLEGSEKNDG